MKKNIVRRRENGLLALGVDLSTVLKSLAREKVTLTDVIDNWSFLCAEGLLGNLCPASLRAGRLEIRADSGGAALEAEAGKALMLERMNAFFGNGFIKEIKITQR